MMKDMFWIVLFLVGLINGVDWELEFGLNGDVNEVSQLVSPLYIGGRANSKMVYYDDALFVFGGVMAMGDDGLFNDLWRFDLENGTWEILSGDPLNPNQNGRIDGNITPGSRAHHGMTIYGGEIYVFGGEGYTLDGERGVLGDLWMYDIEHRLWTYLGGDDRVNTTSDIPGNIPGGRAEFGLVADSFGNLWMFGGRRGLTLNNELWKYTNQWTFISGSGQTQSNPILGRIGVRASFAMTITPEDIIYVYAGRGFVMEEETVFGDIWRFNGIKWAHVYGNQSTIPGGRTGTDISFIENKFFIFGGFDRDKNIIINDLWLFTHTFTHISGNSTHSVPSVYSGQLSPGSRHSYTSCTDGEKLFIFGGIGPDNTLQNGKLRDLWSTSIGEDPKNLDCPPCPGFSQCNSKLGICICGAQYSGRDCDFEEFQGNKTTYNGNVQFNMRYLFFDSPIAIFGNTNIITSNLTLAKSIIIHGDLIINGSKLTFSDPDEAITVLNCTTITGTSWLTTNFTKEQKEAFRNQPISLIETTCLNDDSDIIQKGECVNGEREDYVYDDQNLSIVFASCIEMGYIIVLISIIVVAILFCLLVYLCTPLRRIILPLNVLNNGGDFDAEDIKK